MKAPSGSPGQLPARLRWVLALTRAGLGAEQLVRSFWPLWSMLFLIIAALIAGLQDVLALETLWVLAVIAVLSVAWFGIRGILQLKWPTRADAMTRLDETLPGRPVQALLDAPAIGGADPATQALWQAHQSRMQDKASLARAPQPDLRVARRDPFGLRFVALLCLAMAVMFGSVNRLSSLSDIAPGALAPSIASASWEGWIEPPSYTGLPTLYLNDQPEGDLSVPINSKIILRLYGEIGALTVQETVSARVGELPSSAGAAQEFQLRQNGELSIVGIGGRSWQLDLLPDQIPVVEVVEEARTSGRGEMTLPFLARDDYDILGGQATLELNLSAVSRQYGLQVDPEPLDPVALALPLPISGPRDEFEENLIEDFSDHVWAHLPVSVTLEIEDAAGQKSLPFEVNFNLPARRFFDPLANVLIEQRRDLLWSRENAKRVSQILRAISHRPDDALFPKEADYLRLRMILRRLETDMRNGLTPELRDEIAEDLWELALALEEGDLDDARDRMQRAQERLSEAMRNGASDEEIARLMQELREATQDYMRQLAQQQGNENNSPNQQAQDQNMMELSQNDLQQMMDRIQELMEQGRMAEAQQALEEFQRMMENMQVAEGGQGQQSPGEQAMEELGETLREQQGLSDQAFRELQEQFNPNAQAGQSQQNEGFSGGEGRGQSHEGTGQGREGGEGSGENGEQGLEGALSDQQQALRNELNRQTQNLPGAGTPEGDAAREALGRAGEAMERAEDALRRNQLAEAIDQQAEAMNALREGMRNLGEALADRQEESGGEGTQQGNLGAPQDPLGRNPGSTGRVGGDEELLQGEDVYRRARDLLDEIRRRSGETERPELERNYLRRLLDRF